MQRKIQTFDAVNEEGGDYTVEVWEEVPDVGTRGNPNEMRRGKLTFRTTGNEEVERIAKGVYEIVDWAIRLTSDDPDAP